MAKFTADGLRTLTIFSVKVGHLPTCHRGPFPLPLQANLRACSVFLSSFHVLLWLLCLFRSCPGWTSCCAHTSCWCALASPTSSPALPIAIAIALLWPPQVSQRLFESRAYLELLGAPARVSLQVACSRHDGCCCILHLASCILRLASRVLVSRVRASPGECCSERRKFGKKRGLQHIPA